MGDSEALGSIVFSISPKYYRAEIGRVTYKPKYLGLRIILTNPQALFFLRKLLLPGVDKQTMVSPSGRMLSSCLVIFGIG